MASGQRKWDNKSSTVPGHHPGMVNPPANKLGEGNNTLMHRQRRKCDYRRLQSTQDLEIINPDFQYRIILFEDYTEKGS